MILFVYKFLSFYVIILLICIFCYWRILVVIRRQAKVMAGYDAAGSSATQKNQMQINVIKTMIVVSGFYAISWLPTYIYLLLLNLNPNLVILKTGYYVAEFISWMYICTNPFVYATKFNPVKRVLFRMIPCVKTDAGEQMSENVSNTTTRSVFRSVKADN